MTSYRTSAMEIICLWVRRMAGKKPALRRAGFLPALNAFVKLQFRNENP